MKIAIIIVRILLGALLVFGGVAFFFQLFPQPELTGPVKVFNDGMKASGYLMHLVKAVELVVGLALLSGRFVPLASLVMFPISLNIFLFHALLAPATLGVAIFVLAANIFLLYVCRKNYSSLLSAKIIQ